MEAGMPRRQVGALLGAVVVAAATLAAFVIIWRTGAESAAPGAATMVPTDQGTAHSTFVGNAGFAVAVSALERDAHMAGAPDPGAGLHYVALRVQFRNTSAQQQRADPADFQLRDALGVSRAPTFPSAGASCTRWRMTDLNPGGPGTRSPRDSEAEQTGPLFGPVALCFAAGGDSNGPLTLVWDPDVSLPLFDTPTRIPLQ
jgi:hypothetical protein